MEIREKRSIVISPGLKFNEIETEPGSFLKEITSTKLIPIATGTSVLCSSVAWSFDKTKTENSRELEGWTS